MMKLLVAATFAARASAICLTCESLLGDHQWDGWSCTTEQAKNGCCTPPCIDGLVPEGEEGEVCAMAKISDPPRCPAELPGSILVGEPKQSCSYPGQECVYDPYKDACTECYFTKTATCGDDGFWTVDFLHPLPCVVPDCPASVPDADTECRHVGQYCSYGKYKDACGTDIDTTWARCEKNKWLVGATLPAPCDCPTEKPEGGSSCVDEGLQCYYDEYSYCGGKEMYIVGCMDGEWTHADMPPCPKCKDESYTNKKGLLKPCRKMKKKKRCAKKKVKPRCPVCCA